MAGTLGTIRGQISLDVKSAIAGYVAVRAANAATVYALGRSSSVFLATGAALAGAGVVMAAGLGVAIKAAADFEKQLDFFGAVSASTETQMEAVRKKALQLGADTRYSAGEIADSFVELGKAGISAEDIVNGVGESVANLGAAADIPLEKAAQIMTSAVQTFELKAQDATHVADLLAGAANASIVEIEDLGVSLKYVGGVAAAISLPIEDVVDGLALLGKFGIRGSTAGTSLRQILVSLSGTSKKASKELEKLGIITEDGSNKFFTAEGKAKPLAEIFQVLQDHTEGLTEAQRLSALKIIFNNRALAAASVLTREGAAGFAEMNGEISKTTAADVAAKRLDNLSGDIEILRGNIETLLIQAGTPFQEFLRGIVQGITQLVQYFGNLSEGTQKNILIFIAAFGGILIVLGIISSVIGLVISFVGNIVQLIAAVRFLIPVIKAAAIAFRAFGVALFANPIGLIILAIVALIAIFVVLYKKNETFRNFINKVGASIVTAFHAVVAFFKTLPAFFSNLWSNITSGVTGAWDAIGNFFTQTVPNFFTRMVSAVTSTVSGWISATVGFFQALPGQITGVISSMITSIVGFFATLPARVGFLIGFTIGTIIRLFLQLHLFLSTTVSNIVNSVIQFFALLPGRLVAIFTSIVTFAQAKWGQLRTLVVNLVVALVTAVISFFQQLPGRVASFVSSMVSRAVNLFSTLLARGRALAKSLVDGVISFFQQLPGRISTIIQSMVSQALLILSSMVSGAATLASNVVSAVASGLTGIKDAVYSAVDSAISAFKDAAGRAASAAREFAGGMWAGFKEGLGINSPSFIEKQMVQITEVVGEETKNLRNQVKTVQGLGSRLTNVPSMEAQDQTLLTQQAQAAFDRASSQYARMKSMAQDFQSMQSDIESATASQTAISVSTAAKTGSIASIAPAPAGSNGSRLISGKLRMDSSGEAYIEGVAEDVSTSQGEYEDTIRRMG